MCEKAAKVFYSRFGHAARLKRIPAKDKRGFLQRKQQRAAQRQVSFLKKYLRPHFVLGEIGASKGHFLSLAKKYVKEVVAVEPGVEEAKILRQRRIKHYPWLDDAVKAGKTFDVVAMFHLFEHLSQPKEFLKKLGRVLKKGGLVFVEVPNVDDILISRLNLRPFQEFYFQPMHCFYYNEQTLSNVFRKSDFRLVRCRYLQRYPFSNHLQWLLAGKSGGNEEYERQFKNINKAYAGILADHKLTDTIMCIFKKI